MAQLYKRIYILFCFVFLTGIVSGQLDLSLYNYYGENDITAGRSIILKDGFHITGGNQAKLHIDINTKPYPSEFSIEDVASGFDESNNEYLKLVGSPQGKADVSLSGGATYRVPIKIPPGINGLQPDLNILYNSQTRDGVLGWGWNLSGMSVIGRTGRNEYYNGLTKPVAYANTDDVFVLDGQRLMVVTGSNGTDGTIYGTENEGFAKIESFGGSESSGPDWFQITGKDGKILEYGRDVSSKLKTDNNQSTMYWFLNKIIDRNGNRIVYNYSISTDNRSYLLSSITYGSNEILNSNPSIRIDFLYNIRDNWQGMTVYEGGASINQPYNLSDITVRDASGNTINSYKCEYTKSGHKYFLKFIREFGSNGGELNPISFFYEDVNNAPSVENLNYTFIYQDHTYFGDYNGDGINDILAETVTYDNNGFRYTTGLDVYTNFQPGGAQRLYSVDVPLGEGMKLQNTTIKNSFYNFMSGDYTGDNKDDILKINTHLTPFSGYNPLQTVNSITITSISTSTLSGISNTYNATATDYLGREFIYLPTRDNYFLPGDYDGDGAADYIMLLGQLVTPGQPSSGIYYKAFFSSPVKSIMNEEIIGFNLDGNTSIGSTATPIVTADKAIPLDVDGDGKTELLITKDNMTYILSMKLLPTSSGFKYGGSILSSTNTITKDNDIYIGDFNGDGKSDLLIRGANGKNNKVEPWSIRFGTGSTTSFPFSSPVTYAFPRSVRFPSDATPYSSSDIQNVQIADYDGDGISDIFSYYWREVAGLLYGMTDIAVMHGKDAVHQVFNTDQINPETARAEDFNGDGRADALSGTGSLNMYFFNSFSTENLLNTVANGHDDVTKFNYRELTRPIVDVPNTPQSYRMYTWHSENYNYPFISISTPMKVVKSIVRPNGANANDISTFRYEDAIVQREGKGFLGFSKMTTINEATGIATLSEYGLNTQYAAPYLVKQLTKIISTDEILSEQRQTTSFINRSTNGYLDKRFSMQVGNSLSIDYLTGAASQTTNVFDDYGNVTNRVVVKGSWNGATASAVETSTTLSTYGIHNTPVPALPENITVKNTRDGQPEVNKTTSIAYDNYGNVNSKIECAGTSNAVTSAYQYDIYGNITQLDVSASGINTMTSKNYYDPSGCFTIKKEQLGNGITKSESSTYNSWGAPLTTTTSDGLITKYGYDEYGRLEKTELPDGQVILTALAQALRADGASVIKYDYAAYGGVPDVKTVYDNLGREIAKETSGFGGQKLLQTTAYNAKGQTVSTVAPHYPNEQAVTTASEYDVYGRVTKVSTPASYVNYACQSMGGGEYRVTATNAAGQASSKTTDAAGRTVKATDNGGELNYAYDSWGNNLSTSLAGIVLTSSVYDEYGRQTSLTDKNAGTFAYEYDALGQLTKQTDANGNVSTVTYDDFGRTLSKTGTEGTTTYEYYANGNLNNDNVTKATGFGGDVTEYTYDYLGRKIARKLTVDGQDYTDQYEYDAYGNVVRTDYATGVSILDEYDANGIHRQTSMQDGSKSATLFTATSMNSRGVYTGYTYGNGKSSQVEYDLTVGVPTRYHTPGIQDLNMSWDAQRGNLSSRSDALHNLTETFSYDNLNRLTEAKVNDVQQFAMAYDNNSGTSLGNIASKTDAGNYVYRNDKINAVAYITNPAGAQIPPSVISTQAQQLTYTPFLKTATIDQGDYHLAYTYGANLQRIKGVLQQNGNTVETKYYLGAYEKQITAGTERFIHYVDAGNGLCAMIVRENGVSNIYYVYSDHLGSLLTLTDEAGAIVARQNFDAWGRYRNPDDWTYSNIPPPLQGGAGGGWLYRGYTGHEHLSPPLQGGSGGGFALINMNGRMYDPVQGRMLSPDNFVSSPWSSQGYNRFSYANNNPLVYVDPDGNIVWFVPIIIGAVVGAYFGGATANQNYNPLKWDYSSSQTWRGMAAGAVAGAIAGATWSYGLAALNGSPLVGNATVVSSVSLSGFSQTAASVILAGKAVNALVTIASLVSNFDNGFDLLAGQFYTDGNIGFGSQLLQSASRFTWEGIQQSIGYGAAQLRNTFGQVDDVEFLGGATFAIATNRKGDQWGFTMGSYVNAQISNNNTDITQNGLLMHEYGHYIQGQKFGVLYPFAVALPSLWTTLIGNDNVPGKLYKKHDTYWYELQATNNAANYFRKYYGVDWDKYVAKHPLSK